MFIDCDSHVIEPDNLWKAHLPAELRYHAPSIVLDEEGFERLVYRDIMHRRGAHPKGVGPRIKHLHQAAANGRHRLEVMDIEGIGASFIFPTRALIAYPSICAPNAALAFCRVYNDWLAGFCSHDSARLWGVALIPVHQDMDLGIEEARRAVKELGFRGIVLRPNVINGIYLADRSFDKLWNLVGELNVPILLHEGSSALVDVCGAERCHNYGIRHILSHRLEHEAAVVSMVMTGVFERFQNLRVALLEGGCGWLPSLSHRMNVHFDSMRQQFPDLSMRPSEYIRRNIFVAAESGEPGLTEMLASNLSGQLIFGSDFPHFDSTFPGSIKSFVKDNNLSENDQTTMLYSNPLRLWCGAPR